jgi:hypothetical protein
MRINDLLDETWTKKYKRSIDCSHPKGFSQRAHCAARRKRARGEKTRSKPVREHMEDVESISSKWWDAGK